MGRDADDAIHVVGHHHERIQHDVVAHPFGAAPLLHHDTAVCVQGHPSVDHRTREAHAVVCAGGDEVRARPPVVPPRQANGLAVVLCGVVGHGGMQAVLSFSRHVLNAPRNVRVDGGLSAFLPVLLILQRVAFSACRILADVLPHDVPCPFIPLCSESAPRNATAARYSPPADCNFGAPIANVVSTVHIIYLLARRGVPTRATRPAGCVPIDD